MSLTSARRYALETLKWLPNCDPIQRIAGYLAGRLEATGLADIEPGAEEFLTTWLDRAAAQEPDGLKLRLVIGETRHKHRGERDEWDDGKMVRASSSDGAAGADLVLGLLCGRANLWPRIDYDFLIDEWPDTPGEVATSHLLVVGTAEVNILAAFLQFLLWEVVTDQGLADSLVYSVDTVRKTIHRDMGGGGGFQHPGTILLLKNPWNLEKRLLWVAGLTGKATSEGAQLLRSTDVRHQRATSASVGMVYKESPDTGVMTIVALRCPAATGERGWQWPGGAPPIRRV